MLLMLDNDILIRCNLCGRTERPENATSCLSLLTAGIGWITYDPMDQRGLRQDLCPDCAQTTRISHGHDPE